MKSIGIYLINHVVSNSKSALYLQSKESQIIETVDSAILTTKKTLDQIKALEDDLQDEYYYVDLGTKILKIGRETLMDFVEENKNPQEIIAELEEYNHVYLDPKLFYGKSSIDHYKGLGIITGIKGNLINDASVTKYRICKRENNYVEYDQTTDYTATFSFKGTFPNFKLPEGTPVFSHNSVQLKEGEILELSSLQLPTDYKLALFQPTLVEEGRRKIRTCLNLDLHVPEDGAICSEFNRKGLVGELIHLQIENEFQYCDNLKLCLFFNKKLILKQNVHLFSNFRLGADGKLAKGNATVLESFTGQYEDATTYVRLGSPLDCMNYNCADNTNQKVKYPSSHKILIFDYPLNFKISRSNILNLVDQVVQPVSGLIRLPSNIKIDATVERFIPADGQDYIVKITKNMGIEINDSTVTLQYPLDIPLRYIRFKVKELKLLSTRLNFKSTPLSLDLTDTNYELPEIKSGQFDVVFPSNSIFHLLDPNFDRVNQLSINQLHQISYSLVKNIKPNVLTKFTLNQLVLLDEEVLEAFEEVLTSSNYAAFKRDKLNKAKTIRTCQSVVFS